MNIKKQGIFGRLMMLLKEMEIEADHFVGGLV